MTENSHLSDGGTPLLPPDSQVLQESSSPQGAFHPQPTIVTYRLVGVVFPRLLAIIYLLALLSWNAQWRGLVGSDGILPLTELIAQAKAAALQAGQSNFWEFPSLFYWCQDDSFVQACLYVGILVSLLVIAGLIPGLGLLLLWVLYLSIVVTGNVFTGFQWDSLLLECGFLALFLTPWGLRLPSIQTAPDPPRPAIWLLHWLLFRLMILSGIVKWAGGDDSWQNLTALSFHFETQPLPNPLAWYFHHLPENVHRLGCALMLAVELLLPFGILMGRWGRLAACLGFTGLMTLILLTGNYTFFNLLTIVLSLSLLDDSTFLLLRRRLQCSDSQTLVPAMIRPWLAKALFLPTMGMTLIAADHFLSQRLPSYHRHIPESLHSWAERLAPIRIFNAYGLFQSMTRERPEIIVEVSDDGIFWLPIQFKWKPGPLDHRPAQAAPHQPRLDWQMWFAALAPGYYPARDDHPTSPTYWFGRFVEALLQHQKPVWDLIEPPPIPLSSVAYVRARLARYQFTSPQQRQDSGQWWQMESLGLYTPPLSLPPR